MFCNETAPEGLHVTGEYMDRSMQHTCSRHAAWDPHILWGMGCGTWLLWGLAFTAIAASLATRLSSPSSSSCGVCGVALTRVPHA